MQSLCTLRNQCRHWSRNTRYQTGAAPYLGRTSTGWIAPACLAHSLDHLLGAGKQYPRDHDAESLRRLEIDHKLEFRRCLHRKIRWLGAAENAAHVLRCVPELVYGIHAVRHEAPRLSKVPIW